MNFNLTPEDESTFPSRNAWLSLMRISVVFAGILALCLLMALHIFPYTRLSPDAFASAIITSSLLVTVAAYVFLSVREGSYVNILTPSFIVAVPAYYLLELAYIYWVGADSSSYAYAYVYSTLAIENVSFVLAYTLARKHISSQRSGLCYRNFTAASLACLGTSLAFYAPILIKFREYITDPRRIYDLSRTGGGAQFAISVTLAYLAIIFILFSKRRWFAKTCVTLAGTAVLALHGSKGLLLSLVLLLFLFWVYAKDRRISLRYAIFAFLGAGVVVLGSFASTMVLGDSPIEALQTITQYSDYTRNAMLVIDSNLPPQYGRLTWEANFYAFVPRALSKNKPNDFGPFYLDAEFYPQLMGEEGGLPDFGMGVQYADFGWGAAIYLLIFSIIQGSLAGYFVNRLSVTKHPADFFWVVFLAGISVFSVGVGWLLPEAFLVAMFVRWVTRLGSRKEDANTFIPSPSPQFRPS